MARKEKKAGLPTMGLISVGLICFFLAAAGIGYLWNKSQIHVLGKQMRVLEGQLEEAKRKRQALERVYATMKAPADLDDRVKRMRLEIGPPQPDQIIRLPEASGTPAPTVEKLYARRTSSTQERGQ